MDTRFTIAIENIKQRLRDFTAASSDAPDLAWEKNVERNSVDRDLFPVPHLILFVLHGLCSFPLGYRGEKTHWIVPFSYRDVACAIAHEKFDVRLYITRENDREVNKDELLGKLKKAIEAAEKNILTEIAGDQIKSGNISIANQFHRLGNQYYYFRKKAISSYSPTEQSCNDEGIDGLAEILNQQFRNSAMGAYNALAMIDAYFSRLEHFLVLALPFSAFDRTKDDLTEFVGRIWSGKLRRILDIQSSPMCDYYSRLVAIKEKYRNTFAHGGFEKKGASFYFHLSGFGVIPANMSGHKHSVHFNLFPIEAENFNKICSLFDEVDEWLKETGIPLAWRYAESGLDLRFDENHILEMLAAAADPDAFEEWLDKESYYADLYSNADY